MKKIIIINLLSLFILFSTLIGCASSGNSFTKEDNEQDTSFVKGQIFMVNNEPFSRIGLLNDSSLYLLDYPEEMKNALYNSLGRIAKVYYSNFYVNENSVKVLKVYKVEIIMKKPDD